MVRALPRAVGLHLTPNKRAFLAAYCATASITKAARAAKLDRSVHYQWLLDDPDYPAAWAAARVQAAGLLESEAVRRAYQGIDEPLVYQGNFTYARKVDADGVVTYGKKPLSIRTYSDGLLQFLLKGLAPETYRDRSSTEISGPAGGPILLANETLSKLSDDELAALIALASKLAT